MNDIQFEKQFFVCICRLCNVISSPTCYIKQIKIQHICFFPKMINPKVAVKLIRLVLHVQTAKQTANTFLKRKQVIQFLFEILLHFNSIQNKNSIVRLAVFLSIKSVLKRSLCSNGRGIYVDMSRKICKMYKKGKFENAQLISHSNIT